MNETQFSKLAEDTIQNLSDRIEEADTSYQLETDLLGGVLNIELPDGRQYIINKHDASMQIWLSSPISGASHFDYLDGSWVSSYGDDLLEVLADELEDAAGVVL